MTQGATQMELETEIRPTDFPEDADDAPDAPPAPGRFACPLCGSMLRTGAIMCPDCDADLWTMAHGGPAPSREAERAADADQRLTASGSDGRVGRRSLMLAAAAAGASVLLTLVAMAVNTLPWLWSLLGWATALMSLQAVSMALKAGGRVGEAPDGRGSVSARYALILGIAVLAYEASTFITWSIDQAIRNFRG